MAMPRVEMTGLMARETVACLEADAMREVGRCMVMRGWKREDDDGEKYGTRYKDAF
jgi:hypothetical protein